MIDVTLPSDFPIDLARICQPGAKIYLLDRQEFGTVTAFELDKVSIKLDQGKASSSLQMERDEFINDLLSDSIVAKSRVSLPESDDKPPRIKPRPKPKTDAPAPIPQAPKLVTSSNESVITDGNMNLVSAPVEVEPLLTGYICERTGKFSKTLQPGFVEIKYKKVTKKVELMLDSVQLQKLKELGILNDE